VITGDVTVDAAAAPISGATLTVRLEDVSRTDASSKVIAQVTIPYVSLEAGGSRSIPFQVEVPEMDPNARYILSAHLDVNNSGEITAGDYITMESVPVDERTAAGRVSVRVRPVS
jgi:uncharacterized lipoprotein YbaY